MGDPRRFKSKYSGPGHPWQRARIEEERAVSKEYGLSTKRELWKAESKLKSFAAQAKKLIALRTAQAEIEKKQLVDRVARYGLLSSTAKLDDILGLTVRDLLNRRLQTIVYKKGFARSPRQARQFIVHEHILVGDKKVSAPSYLVPVADEARISFVSNSSLANAEHPERAFKPKPAAEIAKSVAEKKPMRAERKPRRRQAPRKAAPPVEKKGESK
jgi:small subunit ribosomal protein S4